VVPAPLLAWDSVDGPCLIHNLAEINTWLKNLEFYKLIESAVAAVCDLSLGWSGELQPSYDRYLYSSDLIGQ
jgi:hypothetical protein